MGRVINSELPSKRRGQICCLITTAIEDSNQSELNHSSLNDLIAFIILSLKEIEKTVIQTAIQWEKRGYWVKAESFRAEWAWVTRIEQSLNDKKGDSGWSERPEELETIQAQLHSYKPNKTIKSGFWLGAYDRFEKK